MSQIHQKNKYPYFSKLLNNLVDIILKKMLTTFEVVLESGCGGEDRQRFPKNFQVKGHFPFSIFFKTVKKPLIYIIVEKLHTTFQTFQKPGRYHRKEAAYNI